MIEFIVHYISIPDSKGRISEGDIHMHANSEAHVKDILNTLNGGAFYSIRPAKRKPRTIRFVDTYRERVQACPHCSTETDEYTGSGYRIARHDGRPGSQVAS